MTKELLKRNLTLIPLANFMTGLAFIIPIWVSFERQFLTFGQMALMELILSGTSVVLELPTGALADLIGKKRTTALGWMLQGIGNAYTGFAVNGTMIAIGFALVGLGSALVSGANTALVYDTMKELGREKDYPKMASKLSLHFQIALVLSTLAGGYLYEIWKGLPFFMYGFTIFLGGVLYVLTQEPTIDTQKFSMRLYIRQNIDGLKQLTKTAYVKAFSVFYIVVGGITWANMVFFNQPFATEIGYDEIEKSWLFSGLRLFNAIVLFRLLHAEKIITKRRAFLMFPILIAVSMIPAAFSTKLLGIPILMGLMISSTSRFVILEAYMNEEFPSSHRATALSSLNMFVSILYIILVMFGGYLIDRANTGIVLSFYGIGATALLVPLTLVLLRAHSKNGIPALHIVEEKR